MFEATEIVKDKLMDMAFEVSNPFCYLDYQSVKVDEDGQARCPKCGTDDLMRELPGVGVEYGTEWVIEHLVKEEGERVDIDEIYKDLLDEIYEPIRFGELEYSPSHVLELVDSVAFNMGAEEYAQSLLEDGLVISIGSGYYKMDGITE